MNKIEITNLTDEKIDELAKVKEILLYALKKEKLEKTYFSIIIVDEDYIHNLNKTYRNIDKVTDVITFALDDDLKVKNASDIHVLGDIYICLEKCRSQSIEYQHSFLRELAFLAVHGFYHLLGYDHQTKEEEDIMFKKQEEVLNEYGITR